MFSFSAYMLLGFGYADSLSCSDAFAFRMFSIAFLSGLGSLSYFGHPTADTPLGLLCLPFFRRPRLVFSCLILDVALLAPEHDRQFHFVTFFQEFPDLISLGIKSPFAIFGRYLSSLLRYWCFSSLSLSLFERLHTYIFRSP